MAKMDETKRFNVEDIVVEEDIKKKKVKKEDDKSKEEIASEKIEYAFQSLDDLPEGYSCPKERTKPWGTGHALYSARHLINGPFAVINADDLYGPEAYQVLMDFLKNNKEFIKIGN